MDLLNWTQARGYIIKIIIENVGNCDDATVRGWSLKASRREETYSRGLPQEPKESQESLLEL